MIVGIPKEIKNNENRVSLTPAGAHELVQRGHTVYIQHTAGINSGFSDEEYEKVGARILPTIEDVYAIAEMIIKVKEPIECEYNLVRKGQLVFTYFHFACDKELTEAMMRSGSVCLAYETVTEKTAGKVYFDGEVGLKYKGEEEVEITDTVKVAVALKGDTTLDGKVDATDLFETAYYVALQGAGKTPIFDTVKNGTALESKLAYLASDIDTESKAGENTEDGKLDATDMLYTAVYQAYNGAGKHIDWAEAIKMANGGK